MKAERGGGCDLHIDIMDGHYCHNFSFGIDVVPALKRAVKIRSWRTWKSETPTISSRSSPRRGAT